MTIDDIRRLARRGEGRTLEFKHRTPEPERMAKELIAFANTDGGRLLIGVSDDGTVQGVKDATEEEFALKRAIKTHCSPEIKWRSERVEITKKRDVIVVSIPRSKTRPHVLIESNGKKRRVPYVRVDDRSIEASKEAIALMRSSEQVSDVQFEVGEHELALMRYLEEYGRIDVRGFSRLRGLSHEEARKILVLLTRANVLTHHIALPGDHFTLRYNGAN